jgi:hypothetical protein
MKWLLKLATKNSVIQHNIETDKIIKIKPWGNLTDEQQNSEEESGRDDVYHRSFHGWGKAQARQQKLVNVAIDKYRQGNTKEAAKYLGRAMHTLQDRYAHRRNFSEKGKVKNMNIFNQNDEFKRDPWDAKKHADFNDNWNHAKKSFRKITINANKHLLHDFASCYAYSKEYIVYE